MYSVSPEASELWRGLINALAERAGTPLVVIEHAAPAPIDELWQRCDLGAVFMCGLPFSRANPPPVLVAAPVPAPPEFGAVPEYWSEFVVRADSDARSLEDTFGQRLALTVANSQSGCLAALTHFMSAIHSARIDGGRPLYREVVAPTVTPIGALSAVINHDADVAPIDGYALRLLQRYRPELTVQVRTVARTSPTPIPVLIASGGDVTALRSAFLDAHRDAALKPLLDGLLLQRFMHPDPRAYRVLREQAAATANYWREHALATVVHPAFVTNSH